MSRIYEGTEGMRRMLSVTENKTNLSDILPIAEYRELKDWLQKLDDDPTKVYKDLSELGAFEKLYDFYFHEMPYGVAKARTGDPSEWIYDRLVNDFENELLI